MCVSKKSISDNKKEFYSQKLRGLTYYVIQFVPQCGAFKEAIVNNLILKDYSDIDQILGE